MPLANFIAGFKASSLLAKASIGAAVLVPMVIIAGGTRSCVSSVKDARFDKAQQELKAESDGHRKRADEAEQKARALETDAKIASLAVEAAGVKVAEKQELLKQEDARATEDAAVAGETVDAVERCRRLCSRAIKLKLIVATADCGCGL